MPDPLRPQARPPLPAAAPATSVFLIGMMGAGKTTVGRLLAAELGYRFVDCDHEIEHRAGVRIATVFEVEGEAGFRDRESALIEELTALPGLVLATGGGAVLRPHNRRCLHERGLVVFLEASANEIARRTRRDTSRPLLQAPDRRARIDALLGERLPLYRATAHVSFRSAARNPRRLVAAMLAHPALAPLLPLRPAPPPAAAGPGADLPVDAPPPSAGDT
jgi:shikimate kinase